MGRCLDAAFVFVRDHLRGPAFAVTVALVLVGLCAPGVWAGAPARTSSGHPDRVTFAWAVQRRGHVVATHELLAPAGTNTASFTFTAKHPGRYKLTATVTVVTPTVPTPSAVSTGREGRMRLPQ